MVKTLACFNSVTSLVLYYLCTKSNASMLLAELTRILQQAQILSMEDSDLLNVDYAISPLHPMILWKQVPCLPGQDTSEIKKHSTKAQHA